MEFAPWTQPLSIMIVEKNPGLRLQAKRLLEEEGIAVLIARNSVEALVLAADYPFQIDVLFTDADMRVYQNGLELAECIRIMRPETRIVLTQGADFDSFSAGNAGPEDGPDHAGCLCSKEWLLNAIENAVGFSSIHA